MRALIRLLKSNMKLIVSAALVIAILLGVGGVYAAYRKQSTQYGSVTAPTFYFESDFLTEAGKLYNVSAGTTSVSFTLRNSADDLRVSADDITYTLVSTGGTLSVSEGTFAGGVASSATITLSNLESGQEYTVTATADAGFVKTLRATFRIESPATNLYMNTDASDASFVLLTVWAEDIFGDVTVAVPAGLIPDNTDPVMADVENFEDGTYVGVDFVDATSFTSSYCSHVYRFFKTADYDGTVPFAVTMDDGGEGIGAVEKTIE